MLIFLKKLSKRFAEHTGVLWSFGKPMKKQMSMRSLLIKAQDEFNKFIRTRDGGRGCISCGARVTEAGHYYAAGHYTALRFNELNTNGQCTRCNCFLHGNLIHYRNGLLKKYGQQKLDLLDSMGRHKVYKWGRFELQTIFEMYKKQNGKG